MADIAPRVRAGDDEAAGREDRLKECRRLCGGQVRQESAASKISWQTFTTFRGLVIIQHIDIIHACTDLELNPLLDLLVSYEYYSR